MILFLIFIYSFSLVTLITIKAQSCTPSQFTCTNGNCINDSLQCDGYNDCGDNSDERECSYPSYQTTYHLSHPTSYVDSNCTSWQFKCDNGNCIYVYQKCDHEDDCGDNTDERDCKASCTFSSHKWTVDSLTHDYHLTKSDAETIIDVLEWFKEAGIDVQDNLVLIALLFVNIVTCIFIILGLEMYGEKFGFKSINISYITLLIVITQQLLIAAIDIFAIPVVQCTDGYSTDGYTERRISWFNVVQYALSALICLIWIKYSYKGKYKVICAFLTISVIITWIIVVIHSQYISNTIRSGAIIVYSTTHCMIPIVWILLILNDEIGWKCERKLCSNSLCCQRKCTWICICVLMMLIQSLGFMYGVINPLYFGDFTFYIWLNPLWIIINIILLFSEARSPVIMYHVIMIIISVMFWSMPMMSLFVINVTYVTHALLLPMYYITVFFSINELNQWKFDLIHLYLVSFDVATDIIVIYYFFQSEDYIFAVLSIAFVLFAQIFGSFSDVCTEGKYVHLEKGDKLLSLIGLSGAWFLVKSWSHHKYFALAHKHQIWEIMFESIPAVTLQLYATLSETEKDSGTLVISILFSLTKITYSLWMYLVNLTKKHPNRNHQDELKINDESDDRYMRLSESLQENEAINKQTFLTAFSRRRFGEALIQKVLYLNLYIFMLSDFYLRSMPLIIFISSIPGSESKGICGWRVAIGAMLMFGLFIFEFVMNMRMRIKDYQSCCFILTIFPISILSSFCTILSSLELLKNDAFSGKCVDFKSFLFEHKIRIYLSIIMNVINVILFHLFVVNDVNRNRYTVGIFIILYFVVLPVNYLSLNKIQRYADPPNEYPFVLFSCTINENPKECDCMAPLVKLCSKPSLSEKSIPLLDKSTPSDFILLPYPSQHTP